MEAYRLQPDRLPNAGSALVHNPLGLRVCSLLAEGNVSVVSGVQNTHDELVLALLAQGIRDVKAELVIPASRKITMRHQHQQHLS